MRNFSMVFNVYKFDFWFSYFLGKVSDREQNASSSVWNELKMKHAFQSSILCNENDFPTYPRPSSTTGRSTAKHRTLNWSFVDGNTLANPLNVSMIWLIHFLFHFIWMCLLATAPSTINNDYEASLIVDTISVFKKKRKKRKRGEP